MKNGQGFHTYGIVCRAQTVVLLWGLLFSHSGKGWNSTFISVGQQELLEVHSWSVCGRNRQVSESCVLVCTSDEMVREKCGLTEGNQREYGFRTGEHERHF
jgi:hypothetical protein